MVRSALLKAVVYERLSQTKGKVLISFSRAFRFKYVEFESLSYSLIEWGDGCRNDDRNRRKAIKGTAMC